MKVSLSSSKQTAVLPRQGRSVLLVAALVASQSLILSSCRTTVVDLVITFLPVGGVTSAHSGDGLGGVRVFFRDEGLDQWRSQENRWILLGQTNDSGSLEGARQYLYGYEEKKGPLPGPGVFSIRLEKEGCLPQETRFEIGELKQVGGRFELPLSQELTCQE